MLLQLNMPQISHCDHLYHKEAKPGNLVGFLRLVYSIFVQAHGRAGVLFLLFNAWHHWWLHSTLRTNDLAKWMLIGNRSTAHSISLFLALTPADNRTVQMIGHGVLTRPLLAFNEHLRDANCTCRTSTFTRIFWTITVLPKSKPAFRE